jgi:hypothetical protein
MESEVAVDPLRVGDVEKFGDQGLGPVWPVEITVWESQVVVLDKVKLYGSPVAAEKLGVRTMELLVPAYSKYWA